MTGDKRGLQRRQLFRLAGAVGVAAPLGSWLAACAGSETPGGGQATGEVSAENPFGVPENPSVDAVIFDGGYSTDYFEFAGDIFEKNYGGEVKLTATTEISQQLQPRFMGGNPPDIVDNSGADHIPLTSLIEQVEDLNDVIDAENLEGTVIRDTLYANVLEPTTFDDKLCAVNYVMTVFALWHSQTLFDQNGWTAPTTWEEALALGGEAKKQNKFLFCWGKEAASYYLTLIIDSAIKEGGDEVRIALGNLEPDSWSHDAVQGALEGLKAVVDAGYVKPGGGGTQFTAAQAQWSLNQEAILYPSGSWIEAEMKDQTAENFQMVGVPSPSVSSDPALGADAIHGSSSEEYLVPSKAKNVAAGKELIRIMLSEEAATNFAKTKLAVPIVQGIIPPDGFGSTALQSQSTMLETSGDSTFTYNFTQVYGFTETANVVFNSFLAGDMSVEEATTTLQGYSDKVREDDSIPKTEVS